MGRKQVIKWAAEGAVKNRFFNLSSILQREDIRQLSWICQYPVERTAYAVNQGGTADNNIRP